MGLGNLQMKSSQYTKDLIKKQIGNWKNTIANGEFQTVLNAQLKGKVEKLYTVEYSNSWIYKTILDNKIKKNENLTEKLPSLAVR